MTTLQMQPRLATASARDFLNSAFYDRWRIGVTIGLVLSVSVIAANVISPTYPSTTTLLVLMAPEYAGRPDALSTQPSSVIPMEREAILSAEASILKSRDLASTLVSAVSPERLYPALAHSSAILSWLRSATETSESPLADRATTKFLKDLKLSPDKYGSTLSVTYVNPDARVSADALNLLVKLYLQRRQEIYEDSQAALLEDTVRGLKQNLEQTTAELDSYSKTNAITDYATQLSLLLHRQADLRQAQQTNEASLAALGQRVASASLQLQSTPTDVVQYVDSESDRRAQTARDNLTRLRQQESELRTVYTDSSDEVVSVRHQIAALETEIRQLSQTAAPSAVRRGVNEVHSSMELDVLRARNDLAATQQTKRELQIQLASVEGELQDLEAKKTTVEALSRQRSLAEQSFLSATKVFEDRKNAESIERRRSANVRVVETAVPAQKPLPIFGIIIAGGFAMSMLVGILVAVVGDHFRRTFISSERLEREIGVPVLAAVRLTDDLGALARVAGPSGFHDRGVPSVTEPIQP